MRSFLARCRAFYRPASNDQVAESWSELLIRAYVASLLHGAIILRLVIFALGRFVTGLVIGVRFAGRSDVLSARLFQRGFGRINLLRGIAVDREQCAATFDRALISLRFVFWNAKSDERSNYATDRPANTQARQ